MMGLLQVLLEFILVFNIHHLPDSSSQLLSQHFPLVTQQHFSLPGS